MIDLLYWLAEATKVDPEEAGIPVVEGDAVLSGVLNIVYIVAGIVAVISIIVSGILYIVSNGDSGRIQTAKNALLYSVVGLIVVFAAFTITGFAIGKVK